MPAYPNLRHVRLLPAVVATGSITRAGDAVGVTQPAASQALAKLEAIYGGPLFERRGSELTATPRGRLVEARARRALDKLRTASLKLDRSGRRQRAADPEHLERHASIAQLRALAAFAQAGGFAAGARLLGQAEPSVHRAARAMERSCGIDLFEGQPPRLTPRGEMLGAASSLVLKELESAWDDVAELEGRFEGKVVLGTLPLVRSRIVPRAVAAWTTRFPAASLEILDGPYDGLVRSLAMGGIDMLVGALRATPPAHGLVQETLFEDGLAVVARADHPLARVAAPGLADLADYGWVLPRRGTPTRAIFDALWSHDDIPPARRGLVETGSLVAQRGILLETDRLALLSRRQIVHEERAGLLAVLPIELPRSERPIGVATRRGWQPTLLQAEFLAEVRRAAAEE